jgi:hypothetical protein
VSGARSALVFTALLSACGGKPRAAAPEPTLAPAVASAVAPGAPAPKPTYVQPAICPPPLRWENGTPIAENQMCETRGSLFWYQGVCCEYENSCEAPEEAVEYQRRDMCLAVFEAARTRPKGTACEDGKYVWDESACRFVPCFRGGILASDDQLVDCQRPLGADLEFSLNEATISTMQRAELENLAFLADRLGVKELWVLGEQSWDEKPDRKTARPLSVQRAEAVEAVLARVTRIPIVVKDQGTRRRRFVTDEEAARRASVSTAAREPNAPAPASEPFSLPWKICESSAALRTEIAITTDDGDILVEVCRNDRCSRGGIRTSYYAVYPGNGGAAMKGDFDALLSLTPTRLQTIRNVAGARENPGDGKAHFRMEIGFRDATLREEDVYRLHLFRRRTEPVLEWSGKLTYQRVVPNATADVPPCLEGSVALPVAGHRLH